LHVGTEPKRPTLTHVIPSDDRIVVSLTVINDTLFVLRHPSEEKIQVYETATWTQQRTLRVAGLSDDVCWGKSLTASSRNNFMFVCDGHDVYKVDIKNQDVKSWVVGEPIGLSVNDACNIIVMYNDKNEIREYEPQGQLKRKIKLQKSHVTLQFHALQLSDSRFIVSHCGPFSGVSIIEANEQERRHVTASYRSSKFTNRLNEPCHVIVVKNDSFLVADEDNNRLVVLDASLTNARELTLPIDGRLSEPRRLFYTN